MGVKPLLMPLIATALSDSVTYSTYCCVERGYMSSYKVTAEILFKSTSLRV